MPEGWARRAGDAGWEIVGVAEGQEAADSSRVFASSAQDRVVFDDEGTMWRGNASGLARSPESGEILPMTLVDALQAVPGPEADLAVDAEGTVWLTSPLSLWSADGSWERLEHDLQSGEDPRGLALDSEAGLWLGAGESVLQIRADGLRQTYGAADGLSVGRVHSLAADGAALWVGGDTGLARYESSSGWESFERPELLPGKLSRIEPIGDGAVWVMIEGPTPDCAHCRRARLAHVESSGDHFAVDWPAGTLGPNSIRLAPDGRLWASGRDGLFVHEAYRGGGWQDLTDRLELRSTDILDLAFDATGALWILAPDELIRSTAELEMLRVPIDASFGASLAADPQAGIWLGSWGGGRVPLTRIYEDGRVETFPVSDARIDGCRSLQLGPAGRPHCITNSDDLVQRLEPEGSYSLIPLRSAPAAGHRVEQAEDGDLWMVTDHGLARRRAGRWRAFSTADGLPADTITALASRPGGGVSFAYARTDGPRIGPWRAGLGQIDSQGQVSDKGVLSIPVDHAVLRLAHGVEDQVWIIAASFDGRGRPSGPGLLYLGRAEGNWSAIDAPDPHYFQDLEIHPRGELWLTSTRGLHHRSATGTWSLITAGEGLPTSDLSGLHLDAAGALWVGARAALSRRGPDGSWWHWTGADAPQGRLQDLEVDPAGNLWAVVEGFGVSLLRDPIP